MPSDTYLFPKALFHEVPDSSKIQIQSNLGKQTRKDQDRLERLIGARSITFSRRKEGRKKEDKIIHILV
jgi:hypothetical protein